MKHSVHSEADPQLNASAIKIKRNTLLLLILEEQNSGEIFKKNTIVLSGQNNIQLLILHFLYKKS